MCPEEHIESFGRLLGMLMSEVPLGELDLEASEWTPSGSARPSSARSASAGTCRPRWRSRPTARSPGVSDVRVDDTDPAHGQVGITLVDPAHRGHRLGWRSSSPPTTSPWRRTPSCVSVDTSNAEVNTWMNAVNEALGYRTIETLLELQKGSDQRASTSSRAS